MRQNSLHVIARDNKVGSIVGPNCNGYSDPLVAQRHCVAEQSGVSLTIPGSMTCAYPPVSND